MNQDKMASRTQFSRQPARCLLVDLRSPMTAATTQNISQALNNVFALVNQLTGRCRIPFFGLYIPTRCLFPLQHVRGNFSKLKAAIDQMTVGEAACPVVDCLIGAIEEILLQYKRQVLTLKESDVFFDGMELTIMTCLCSYKTVREVSDAAARLTEEMEQAKLRIRIVNLEIESNGRDTGEVLEIPTLQSVEGYSEIISEEKIGGDILSIESLFKYWLQESSGEDEHLHLILPSLFNKDLIVKCDLLERLLSPDELPLPCQPYFSLSQGKVAKEHGQHTALYKLKAIKQIPVNSICESVVFGQPWLLNATNCWKLSWEDLEANRQNFLALCRLLYAKNLAVLVAASEDIQKRPSSLKGHFVVIASGASSLLLKSVATRELLLPADLCVKAEKPSEDAVKLMEKSLSRLVLSDSYNPLTHESNLYSCLTAAALKSVPPMKQVKRKLPMPPMLREMQGKARGLMKPFGLRKHVVNEEINELARKRKPGHRTLLPLKTRRITDLAEREF